MSPVPEILQASQENIERAALALRHGRLVGMPTETVYGLGASIFHDEALRAIFTYK
ncbi:MAG: Sua5/YciO/YrdC/YwlC family protein, partial [Proteobacteria bacterium]|nr:Sua5/YciO/YrdC/YwlC family protein [Pseudomonadota bacterium]